MPLRHGCSALAQMIRHAVVTSIFLFAFHSRSITISSLPSPPLEPSGEVVLPESAHATMATGDQFIQDDAQRARIAGLGAQLVDMEGYAYASACERFGVPLQIFKVPSDFADSDTTIEDWDAIVVAKSHQLREFWDALGA